MEILAGQEVLMVVTEGHAQAVGRSRRQLGEEYAEIIRHTVAVYRQEHTLGAFFRGLAFSLCATTVLLFVFFALVRIRRVIRGTITQSDQRELLSTDYLVPSCALSGRAADRDGHNRADGRKRGAIGNLRDFSVQLFPLDSIHLIGPQEMDDFRIDPCLSGGMGLSLVIVVVFLIAARALIRVNNYVFQEIREGT
jgi:hypothetical protein